MTKLNETKFTVFKFCRFSLFLKDLFFQIILNPEVDVTFYNSKRTQVVQFAQCPQYDSKESCVKCMCRSRGGEGGGQGVRTPPEKSQKYRVSKQYWSGSPEKSQSYQASIQIWANIGTPAKGHFNGALLAGQ